MDPMTHAAPSPARRNAWPRRLAWIVLAPPLAALALVLGARALPPGDEAQAAIDQVRARLQARAPVEDGYALLYFAWRSDHPREGLDAALADAAAHDRTLLDAAGRDRRLVSFPLGPSIPEDATALATCMPRCLDDAAPGGPLAALAERHAGSLARLQDALWGADAVGPGRLVATRSMADFFGPRALVGLRAVAWRAGRREEALEASCRDLQAAERMALAHPDSGIEAMVGINQYQLTATQLAMMLADAPGTTLPPACEALRAPPVHTTSAALCRIADSEFAWVASYVDAPVIVGRAFSRGVDERWEPWLKLLESAPHTLGAVALEVDWACSPAVAADMDAGRLDSAPRALGWHARLASPLEAWPDRSWSGWHPYRARLLDFDAVRRALGARLHLHVHGVEGEDGLAGLPAWTRVAHAPLSLGPDGLVVPQHASALGDGRPVVLPMWPAADRGAGEVAP